MRRPLPTQPRGPRRVRPRPTEVLLACPRVDPKWELGALRALMKPQTRGAIEHRDGEQRWPADGDITLARVSAAIADRLGLKVALHRPEAGDFFLAARVPAERQLEGLALAIALSGAMPALWFTYGRLYLQAGRIYRRERGVKLWLVEAANVHLPRQMRAALRGVV